VAGPAAKEATVVNHILRALREIPGCHAEKTHGDRFGAQRLDLTGCYNGRRFEFEVKRPGGRPTVRQAETMARWAAAGAIVACVHGPEEAVSALGVQPNG
jgi:hypothetical protein